MNHGEHLERPVDFSQAHAPVQLENLKELLAGLSKRPVPVGSLNRLWSVGELSTQIALAYFALWIRQWIHRSPRIPPLRFMPMLPSTLLCVTRVLVSALDRSESKQAVHDRDRQFKL